MTPRVNAISLLEDNSSSLPPSKRFNFIADAVETVQAAVVYIEVTDGRVAGMFGYHAGPTSSGSGFFVTEEGMVLTNAHVVANAIDVSVKLRDGRQFKGVVVDIDPVKDLAAIKLNASQGTKFSTIKLGSSSSLRPGEWVIAMGSPLTLSNTITAGIVSTVHRGGKELGLPNSDMEYIQTDAAINVGNSGGPLVNLDGEVIGISAITVKFAAGISFAIPIDAAKEFLKGAQSKKIFTRSGPQRILRSTQRWYIGINMLTLSPQILEELQRRDSNFENLKGGVFVAGVNHRSPAVAGLMSGDVITKINGQNIATSKDVFEYVKRGETLKMNVQRGTQTVSLTVQPQVVG
ncbi:hypothetical protein QZH41_002843 [Actinostola sp. cb2023]|nr:hypothetical protein QZH41_002843 [Actinostola sp. cb2023]